MIDSNCFKFLRTISENFGFGMILGYLSFWMVVEGFILKLNPSSHT